MHWHEERMPGVPQPIQYERNLYLAAGVTTARELGGNFEKSKLWREQSAAHRIVSPRIVLYTLPSRGKRGTPDEIRAGVREAKARGADGLKIMPIDRDQLEALLDEAHKVGLPTTAHIGVEETTARDFIELGVTLDRALLRVRRRGPRRLAALPGRHELRRRDRPVRPRRRALRAGRPRRSSIALLDLMVEKKVAWSPTLSIYEACRDLLRHQNLPWYRDYLHPSMEAFWQPGHDRHGSFFVGWTNTQEARWRQNYRIWMDAVRAFGAQGRHRSRPATMPATSGRSTGSASCASWSCRKRRASTRST